MVSLRTDLVFRLGLVGQRNIHRCLQMFCVRSVAVAWLPIVGRQGGPRRTP